MRDITNERRAFRTAYNALMNRIEALDNHSGSILDFWNETNDYLIQTAQRCNNDDLTTDLLVVIHEHLERLQV